MERSSLYADLCIRFSPYIKNLGKKNQKKNYPTGQKLEFIKNGRKEKKNQKKI